MDENRKRFEAETSAFDIETLKKNRCLHSFIRKTWGTIECQNCRIGYNDANKLILKDGKIVGVK